VFHGGGYDVLAAAISEGGGDGDRPVVPLGSAGGKEKLIRAAAQRIGSRTTAGFQSGGGFFSRGLERGWVSVFLRHGAKRRRGRRGNNPCGGRVIQIYRHPQSSKSISIHIMAGSEKSQGKS
jgi:hypothetical protein